MNFLFGLGDLEIQVEKARSLAPNAQLIVVKQGKDGATAFTSEGERISHGDYRVDVLDELGAGDAFLAAFLASMLLGKDLSEALRFANAAGALTVTAQGDLEPLPTWRDLEPVDLTVGLSTTDGTAVALPLGHFAPINPPLTTRVMKPRPLERMFLEPSELVLQTYELPLAEFARVNSQFNPAKLTTIRIRFDRSPKGQIVVDDVGFAI